MKFKTLAAALFTTALSVSAMQENPKAPLIIQGGVGVSGITSRYYPYVAPKQPTQPVQAQEESAQEVNEPIIIEGGVGITGETSQYTRK